MMHEIELIGGKSFHGELPPRHVGYLLAEIQPAAQAAVAMAFRNRSSAKGKCPDWLQRASDVRFVGFSSNGTTHLKFHAPTLEVAAGELYRQGELFSARPAGSDTALELLGDTLADVAGANENSDRFDRPLLGKIVRLGKALKGDFQAIVFRGRNNCSTELTKDVVNTARRFRGNTPPSRRVRIVGKLDAISDSRQAFELLMDDGQRVRGTLLDGAIAELARLFRARVLIFGQAQFRPSGLLLRIDANEFREATSVDDFFAKLPKPIARRVLPRSAFNRETMAKGLKSIIGQWPGDESDEEFAAALAEIS